MASVEFRVLGPLELIAQGEPVTLGPRAERALLGILLLSANRMVPRDAVIEELWLGRPPGTVDSILRTYVSRIRGVLARCAAADVSLSARGRGYRLSVPPDAVDALRFERLLGAARDALSANEPGRAAAILGEALRLWRGPPLADLADGEFAAAEIARLEEQRLEALEQWVDASLRLGRHGEVLPELERLCAEHPFRERFLEQVMIALYRSGRQADALARFRHGRRMLAEELGLEPTAALRELERAILEHAPWLDVPPAATPPEPASEERRTVTAIAWTVAAAAGESLDPEARRVSIVPVVEAVRERVRANAGVMERELGDVLAALFGVSTATDDYTLTAVRAAIEGRAAAATVAATVRREHGVDVFTRFGVATTEVVFEKATSGDVRVFGDVEALAVALQADARRDEIRICPRTDARTRWALKTEAAAVADARRVLGIRSPPSTRDMRRASSLVGRRDELSTLTAAFRRTMSEERSRMVAVVGDPGIGKTRLAAEFLGSLRPAASRVLVTAPSSHPQRAHPLGQLVVGLCGDPPHEQLERVLPDEEKAVVTELVLAPSAGEAASVSPEETAWAFSRLLCALSRVTPAAVVWDDVDGAEPAVSELFRRVAGGLDARVLFVRLARAVNGAFSLETSPTETVVHLAPISDVESEQFVDGCAGGRTVPVGLRDRMLAVAGGNPFFLEQLVALALDDRRRSSDVRVPETTDAVLGARLGALSAGERAVIARAAVVGDEFSPDDVIELLPDSSRSSAQRQLESLVVKQFLRREGADERRYAFKHGLVREAAYATTTKAARADLHERWASYLAQPVDKGTGAEHAAQLAEHLEQAARYRIEIGLVDERTRQISRRAAGALAAAGRAALSQDDRRRAARLLERAVSLSGEEPERSSILLDLADSLQGLWDLSGAQRAVAEALRCAAGGSPTALRADLRRMELRARLESTVTPAELARAADRAIRVFHAQGDEQGLVDAYWTLTCARWAQAKCGEADDALARRLEHARRAGDMRSEAQTLTLLTEGAAEGPRPVRDGIRLCEETLAALENRPARRSLTLLHLAYLRAMRGEHESARGLLAEAAAIRQELRLATPPGVPYHAGQVALLAGDLASAVREFRSAYDVLEQSGDRAHLADVASVLGRTLYAQRRLAEADRFASIAEHGAGEADVGQQAGWRTLRALVEAAQGNLDTAERLSREAIELASSTDLVNLQAETLLDGAFCDERCGARVRARKRLRRAISLYGRKENLAGASVARRRLAALVSPERTRVGGG